MKQVDKKLTKITKLTNPEFDTDKKKKITKRKNFTKTDNDKLHHFANWCHFYKYIEYNFILLWRLAQGEVRCVCLCEMMIYYVVDKGHKKLKQIEMLSHG